MHKVLIIDDEDKLRELLSRIIQLEGFEVIEAADFKTAFKKLGQHDISVVLCDVKLPDGNGVDEAHKIKQQYPTAEVILLTAYGNIADGVQAIKNGAFDYIIKGDDNNKIIPLLNRAIEKVELANRVLQLEKQLGSKNTFEKILGDSDLIKNAVHVAQKVAATDTTVLLTGETGSGKEVFAQAIHHASQRSKQNFVALNCSAFSKDLLENEMFGHKAGAFTGATKDQKGLFEEAHNGTLFLDEIGEMALELQAKLLRVIETGEFIKVGDNKPTKVNVRLIAATNRNLQNEIEQGHFRQDLFYRISVFEIKLPSLRERISDIETLALFFLNQFAIKTKKKITGMETAFLKALQNHEWPGNIRELKNIIERSVILTEGTQLKSESLPLELPVKNNLGNSLSADGFELATAEKLHIQKVLAHTRGNKTKAAELLNIALTTLYRKIEEYGIQG